ncbi:MAG: pyridoxal 5'-phosphate synthase glutaminase subunit PdxT [Candidatus Dormibacteria bacterium]
MSGGPEAILRIGVLALQGDVREHLVAFRRSGAGAVPVRSADELLGVHALALPGGESTTMSRLIRAFGLEAPLRRRLADGMPSFSTCAGTILLSREILDGTADQLALGTLDLRTRRNGYGRQLESFECDLDVPATGPDPFRAVFIRAPVIESCGPGVEVLASVEGRPVAIRQGRHLSFTFHPEMTGDLRLHRLFLEGVGEAALPSEDSAA